MEATCRSCGGALLKDLRLAVKVGGKKNIGLHYVNISRRSDSISGGEIQLIKMSIQISSEPMDMLYVIDEPSIGLHARDSDRVINIMKQLRT